MHAFSSSPAALSDPPRRLAEQDYERLDHLLGGWALVLVLAVLVVSALR